MQGIDAATTAAAGAALTGTTTQKKEKEDDDGDYYNNNNKNTIRRSSVMGNVRVVRQDRVAPLRDSVRMEPIRILVTLHHQQPLHVNAYEKGLGYWVYYIFSKYLQIRNVPYRMCLKSIMISGNKKTNVKTVTDFIRHNHVDVVIPTDTTDTMFLAKHVKEIKEATAVKIAVTPNVNIYETLEDKWLTYNFALEHGIPTPKTEKFDELSLSSDMQNVDFPIYLKVASGTNAGRGVVLCHNQEQVRDAHKEFAKRFSSEGSLLLVQQAVTGARVVQGQFSYCSGKCVAFFFSELNDADDLAGGASKFIFSKHVQGCSARAVHLEDDQWDAVTEIAVRIGEVTAYHGFMDIEFLIPSSSAQAGNNGNGNGNGGVHVTSPAAAPAAYLLECNPRFSGDIHTTLSNPGFLDAYFDILYDRIEPDQEPVVYSKGIEITTRYKDFDPANFYLRHPLQVLSNRFWKVPAEMTFTGRKLNDDGGDDDDGCNAAAAVAPTRANENHAAAAAAAAVQVANAITVGKLPEQEG